jgi:hypothetical protein
MSPGFLLLSNSQADVLSASVNYFILLQQKVRVQIIDRETIAAANCAFYWTM